MCVDAPVVNGSSSGSLTSATCACDAAIGAYADVAATASLAPYGLDAAGYVTPRVADTETVVVTMRSATVSLHKGTIPAHGGNRVNSTYPITFSMAGTDQAAGAWELLNADALPSWLVFPVLSGEIADTQTSVAIEMTAVAADMSDQTTYVHTASIAVGAQQNTTFNVSITMFVTADVVDAVGAQCSVGR